MKHLFLIRHGKSSWSDSHLSDWDRPLKKRGKRQLGIMAGPLAKAGAFSGAIYSSDAERARQTINGMINLQGDNGVPARVIFKPKLYTFEGDVLFKWLRKRRDRGSITLVGHNPALLDLANTLLRQPIDALPTGSCIHVLLPIRSWRELVPDSAALVNLMVPTRVSYREFQKKQPADPVKNSGLDQWRAMTRALVHSLERLKALEPGIRLGFDPEFLHQYRIAIRKIRGVLETLYRLTNDRTLKKPTRSLRDCARATSELRDLDVFLGKLIEWQNNPENHDALVRANIITVCRQRHREAHRRLVDLLDSKNYRDQFDRWQTLIQKSKFNTKLKALCGPLSGQALLERIADHNARLGALTETSPDDDVHRLRKCLKRIRYLCDLDPTLPASFLKALRHRQTLMGEFQDHCMQQTLLTSLQKEAADGDALAPLIARIEAQKLAARWRIMELEPIDDTPIRDASAQETSGDDGHPPEQPSF
ncbi:CHAD domain-containing protein [Marinobacter caseinilyticus]|uniref:CHAD domain-containing protein n=1 Tax=Marinobacter caseinilyticus TaxID=2692195 RepID=UPI001407D067|nr:CHAD domain-containing protein [Marinobacter caseinilyticus]